VRGALHEVFAHPGHEASATGFAVGVAAISPNSSAEKSWAIQRIGLRSATRAATGLLELGIDPSRFLMLRVAHAEEALRAASDALTCCALGAVVIEVVGEHRVFDLKASRRITLGAAETNVTALLLRFNAVPDTSSAETRWMIRAARSKEQDKNWGMPRFDAELARNRHGRTGRWVMEWNCDNARFAADRGAVVSAPFDRPAAAAMEGEKRRAVA
jgi:protein ImuA